MRRSSRVVFLHIGAPKTGTTYIQERLAENARELAEQDVHYPSKGAFFPAPLFHFRAALDLLDQDWGGDPGHAEGTWPTMVRQVRRRTGTVIVSHEILATAPPEKIARVMRDIEGSEVHIIYTARDLVRQIPAAWQESIKQGRTWRYRPFLNKVQRGDAWFMKAFDLPTVLNNWSRDLPPERVHVITVPPPGSEPGLLWNRFCRVVGIERDWAPRESESRNESLGIAETELLRRLNERLGRKARSEGAHDALIQKLLNEGELSSTRSRRVVLPPKRFDWADEQAQLWIDWIEGAGVDVVGDIADLRPERPDPTDWLNPDKVSGKALTEAGLQALTAMTREAATRPDPARELGARIRNRTERLRNR
ncbi:MAG: hypothetical protein L0H93_09665 [Nocardioides sp.]|nr:hypothetical protein [Nocardioides sp.]